MQTRSAHTSHALQLFVSVFLPTFFCLQLQDAYAEVYRVLKPGCYFASYEWVSTKKYDPKNRDHVRIMDEINYGNGLPVRPQSYRQANTCIACVATVLAVASICRVCMVTLLYTC